MSGRPLWTSARAMRYALEVRTPEVVNLPTGLPAGATLFDINSPAPLNFVFFTFVPAGPNAVPVSVNGAPWSLLGFPDYYPLNNFYRTPAMERLAAGLAAQPPAQLDGGEQLEEQVLHRGQRADRRPPDGLVVRGPQRDVLQAVDEGGQLGHPARSPGEVEDPGGQTIEVQAGDPTSGDPDVEIRNRRAVGDGGEEGC